MPNARAAQRLAAVEHMTKAASVSAVITYHESPETIGRVLDGLLQQDHVLEQIVIVDNGSRQGLDHLASMPARVSVIRLPAGTGLSRARNVGLAKIQSEFALVLDDDIYLAPDCLNRMMAAGLETGASAVCPRIVFHPADAVIQCDGASIHFAGMLALNNKNASISGLPRTRHRCGAFIGACVLFNRQLLTGLGGFDEDYYFYFEDLELSYRLREHGHEIWCEPNGVVFHDRGLGTPALSFRGQERYPAQRAYFNLRHRWLTMLLHYQVRTLTALLPALALYDLAALAECIRRGFLAQWLEAVRSILRMLPQIQAKRARWQAERTIADGEILTGGPLPFAAGLLEGRIAARMARLLGALMQLNWNLTR